VQFRDAAAGPRDHRVFRLKSRRADWQVLCSCGSAEVRTVINRSRIVFTVAALAVASVAAATIRWQTWTSGTACLLCGARDPGNGAVTLGGSDRLNGAGGAGGSYALSSAETFTPGPLKAPSIDPDAAGSRSPASRHDATAKGWQPWGNGSGTRRVSATGSSTPSTSLGGLWRLMSLSRPGHVAGESIVHTAPIHTPTPAVSRPAKPTPTPTHHSAPHAPGSGAGAPNANGGSSSSSGDASSTPSTGSSASTDPFHEHENPPDPFHGPGGFNPGTPGGKGTIGGSGPVSPTPEPGSILLIGTGLLGILGVFRKRQAF
jgi:hypothetical protein